MENNERELKRHNFLSQICGLKNYKLEGMIVDGSPRLYYRVWCEDGKSSILMDDLKGWKIKEFVELSAFLRQHNIYAPEVYYNDLANNFLLLEDLGKADLGTILRPENEKYLFKLAVDALLKIYHTTDRPTCVKDVSEQVIIDNFCLFLDWYMPRCLGREIGSEKRKEFLDLVAELMPMAYKLPNALVLWDYHVNNVMLPEDSDECAIIDFQDALWGPSLYDLVSLIEDERRDINPETTNELKEYFYANITGVKRQDFDEAYAYLSMLRHMRVLGRFTTLITRDKKPWYINYIPHAVELLNRSLEYPKFAKIKKWLDENFPAEKRGLPKPIKITKAFVLAAGRGVRMGELTNELPKPLIEVNGKTLIDYNFDKLAELKIFDVVVNLCYKGEMIKNHLQHRPDFNITFSEEVEALETGGGIKNALHLMGDEAFFAMNSDTFWKDGSFKAGMWRMIDEWDDDKYDILLLLHPMDKIQGDDNGGIGNYRINENNKLERNAKKEAGFPYWYTGVSILHPRVFENSPAGKFSLRDLFDKAEKNGRLGYVVNDGILFHVGIPEAVKQAEIVLGKK